MAHNTGHRTDKRGSKGKGTVNRHYTQEGQRVRAREILNLIEFILVLSAGIQTLRQKTIPKTDFACCWIILLLKIFKGA